MVLNTCKSTFYKLFIWNIELYKFHSNLRPLEIELLNKKDQIYSP
jgi:hypothetical protein